MIYVKTNLKKIPKSCAKCKFSNLNRYFSFRFCSLLNNAKIKKTRLPSGNYGYVGRLKNCPLIEGNNVF